MAEASVPFDALAFIADMKAAGVHVIKLNGHVFFRPADGFGEDFRLAMLRWSDAIQASADWIDQVAALASEHMVPEPA